MTKNADGYYRFMVYVVNDEKKLVPLEEVVVSPFPDFTPTQFSEYALDIALDCWPEDADRLVVKPVGTP